MTREDRILRAREHLRRAREARDENASDASMFDSDFSQLIEAMEKTLEEARARERRVERRYAEPSV